MHDILLSFNCSPQIVAAAVDLSVSRLSLWNMCFTYLSGRPSASLRLSELLGGAAWVRLLEVVRGAKQTEFREHVSASVIMFLPKANLGFSCCPMSLGNELKLLRHATQKHAQRHCVHNICFFVTQ